jgi:IMP dehydrogenase/GMP reductase
MEASAFSGTVSGNGGVTQPRSPVRVELGDSGAISHLMETGMRAAKIVSEGITFDDVLLIPLRSGVMPADADTTTRLTRSIRLNIPLISAPMDTVTESALAIALAQEGGIGIIHKNLSVEAQAREVAKVKRSANGVISDPITLGPDRHRRPRQGTDAPAQRLGLPHHRGRFSKTLRGKGKVLGISRGVTSSSSRIRAFRSRA